MDVGVFFVYFFYLVVVYFWERKRVEIESEFVRQTELDSFTQSLSLIQRMFIARQGVIYIVELTA